jgi:hypothetical protein
MYMHPSWEASSRLANFGSSALAGMCLTPDPLLTVGCGNEIHSKWCKKIEDAAKSFILTIKGQPVSRPMSTTTQSAPMAACCNSSIIALQSGVPVVVQHVTNELRFLLLRLKQG